MSTLRDRARDTAIRFVWNQWAQMGVFGSAVRSEQRAADPEALLLFTLEVSRSDPRLFDEVLDWLALNGRLFSQQRIRNLMLDGEQERLVGAALAWASHQAPALRSSFRPPARPTRELLFRIGSGRVPAKPDPMFRRYGFLRPLLSKPSGKSRPPDVSAPISYSFRLRQLFGVGTRAEVIRYLTTVPLDEVSTKEVAWAAGYAKRNVAETLGALTGAGVIETRRRWNEDWHGLDQARWMAFLGVDRARAPQFAPWPQLLRAAREMLRWLDADAAHERSDYLRASSARDLVDAVSSDLAHAGIPTSPPGALEGEAYLPFAEGVIETTLRVMSGQETPPLLAPRAGVR